MSPDYGKIFAEYSESCEPGAVLRCFSDIKSKPIWWLWPGRIPLGKLTLLIGDPGLGKSLLTADVASRVTRGTSFPDGAVCESGSVIFLSAEDDAADTIRPRLDAAGADVSRVHTLDAVRVQLSGGSVTEKAFNLETDCAHLESALSQRSDVRLVVIDPLSAYLGGTDSHSNAEIRGLLSPLAALAARCQVAVLAITHLRKSSGPAVHRAIGSIAFAAAARAVWAVAPDPTDSERRLLLAVKQNLSAPASGKAFRVMSASGAARLEWEPGTVTISANDVFGEASGAGHGGVLAEARDWLADVLSEGQPIAANEVKTKAKAAGITATTLRRAADSLGVVPRKSTFSGGWEWQLKSDHREDAHSMNRFMSTFEQPTENTTLNDNRPSEDAHGTNVSIFDAFSDDNEVRL